MVASSAITTQTLLRRVFRFNEATNSPEKAPEIVTHPQFIPLDQHIPSFPVVRHTSL